MFCVGDMNGSKSTAVVRSSCDIVSSCWVFDFLSLIFTVVDTSEIASSEDGLGCIDREWWWPSCPLRAVTLTLAFHVVGYGIFWWDGIV